MAVFLSPDLQLIHGHEFKHQEKLCSSTERAKLRLDQQKTFASLHSLESAWGHPRFQL